ncbi:MAG: hypothetical protein JJE22_03395 [Bacteroidia bacterium]|nr:hypothetical protein [Bacteroidia bacterium]
MCPHTSLSLLFRCVGTRNGALRIIVPCLAGVDTAGNEGNSSFGKCVNYVTLFNNCVRLQAAIVLTFVLLQQFSSK